MGDDNKLAKDDLEYVMNEIHPGYGGADIDPERDDHPDKGRAIPKAQPDIPKQSAIVKTQQQASYLARKMVGGRVPNEATFSCIACGKKRTYQFDAAELDAIPERDPRRYPEIGGRCLDCNSEALVLFETLENGDDFQSALAKNREARREEYQDAAKVVVETIKDEFFGARPAGAQPQPSTPGKGPGDDLPDAADVDMSNVGERKTE